MKRDAKTAEEFQKVANRQAHGSIASMRDDLAALAHAQECKGTTDSGRPCKKGSEYRTVKRKDGTTYKQNQHENPEYWHDADGALRHIEESPLSIEVRSDWYTLGADPEDRAPGEYNILLGTGGPATRIIGDLENGSPSSARFEYQDWFKPWTAAQLSREDESTLLEWAQVFCFEY